MPRVLAEALEKRGRKWGAMNAAILAALRDGTLPCRFFPSRPQQALSDGAFLSLPSRPH